MASNSQKEKIMKYFIQLLCTVTILAWTAVEGYASNSETQQNQLLIFSNNLHGELEPCG